MAENVTIRFDASGIRRTLRKMGRVGEKLEDLGLTGDRLRSVFRGLRRTAVAVGAAFGAMGVAAGALVREAVQAGSALEQTGIRLDSIMGSAEAGQASLEGLTEAAAQLPFTFEEITNVAPALGVIADDADELQTRLFQASEISARFGISLQETASNMVRFFTAGANSADLFRERGVLQALGVVAGEQTTLEESKRLWSQFFQDIERSGSSALGRLASSFEGRLSMVQDAWFRLMGNIAESGVMDAVKRSLSVVQEEMARFMDSGAAEDFAVAFTNALALMVGGIQGMINALGELQSFVRDTPIIRGMLGMVGIDVPRTARGQLGEEDERLQRLQQLRDDMERGAARGSLGPRLAQAGLSPDASLQEVRAAIDGQKQAVDRAAREADRTANVMSRFNEAVDRVQASLRGEGGAGGVSVATPRLTQMVSQMSPADLLGMGPIFQPTAAQEMMLAPSGGVGGPQGMQAGVMSAVGGARGLPGGEIPQRVQEIFGTTDEALNRAEDAAFDAADGFNTVADVAITSMGQAVQAAVQGFDNIASIVINTVTSIVQSLGRSGGPLSGFLGGFGIPVIGALGGILSAVVSSGSDRPQPVEIKNRDPIPVEEQRRQGPNTVIVQFPNPITGQMEEIQYELGRRSRRDATERIPPGVNLGLAGA